MSILPLTRNHDGGVLAASRRCVLHFDQSENIIMFDDIIIDLTGP